MVMIGAAFFFTLLDRLTTQLPLLTMVLVIATLALTAAPMLLVFTRSPAVPYYNYPPYLPPILSYVTHLSPGDQWVTSDMPWATAWYGDRPPLWVPDSVTDFTNINDNVCESSMILFTPLTLEKPIEQSHQRRAKRLAALRPAVEHSGHVPLAALRQIPGRDRLQSHHQSRQPPITPTEKRGRLLRPSAGRMTQGRWRSPVVSPASSAYPSRVAPIPAPPAAALPPRRPGTAPPAARIGRADRSCKS